MLLKIGQTQHDPEDRAAALSTTGVPENFKVEYSALVEDYVAAERKVHQVLSHARAKDNREFFKCTIAEAILTIRSSCKVLKEITDYKSPEEITRLKNEIEKSERKKSVVQNLRKEVSTAVSREELIHAEKQKKKSTFKNLGLWTWLSAMAYILMGFPFGVPSGALVLIPLIGGVYYFVFNHTVQFEPAYSEEEIFLIAVAHADEGTIYDIQMQPDKAKKRKILSDYERKKTNPARKAVYLTNKLNRW